MLIIILVRGINKVLEKIRFMNNKVNNKKKEINFVLKEYTNHKVIIKKNYLKLQYQIVVVEYQNI